MSTELAKVIFHFHNKNYYSLNSHKIFVLVFFLLLLLSRRLELDHREAIFLRSYSRSFVFFGFLLLFLCPLLFFISPPPAVRSIFVLDIDDYKFKNTRNAKAPPRE